MEFNSKFKYVYLKVITNPVFLTSIIAFIVIFTLPPIFNQYVTSIVNVDRDVNNKNIFFDDLDNDGISEKIRIEQMNTNLVSLQVFKNDKVIDQWNFIGRLPRNGPSYCGDIDGDGTKEIFVFVYNDNSHRPNNNMILLNCVNPIANKFLFKDKPVVEYIPFDEMLDCTIMSCGFYDENNDGINEFYFATTVGHSLKPRKFFAFDPAHDTIFQSPESYAGLTSPLLFDLDNKTTPDFIFATDATGNSDTSAAFSDMHAWLMVFTKNAAFQFPPVKIGYYPSWSRAIQHTDGENNFIVTMNIYFGTDNHDCRLSLFNSEMMKIKEKIFSYSDDWFSPNLHYDTGDKPNFFYIIKKNGFIEKLDRNFDIMETKNIPAITSTMYYPLDINGDSKNELIFQSDDLNNLIITRNDLSDHLLVNCAGAGNIKSCSVKQNRSESRELYVLFNEVSYSIIYKTNPLYYLRYPLYVGIYLIIFSLIWLIQKGQKHRAELKYETEKRIAELQISSIKNQLDPHFTLNIINSIGSLFHKHDNEKADYIFGKYSKLLRSTILNSDKIVTTLSSELEFVENYLELEKFRCSNAFQWQIRIDDNVHTGINIPKMLIHTFVENSVKHGLKHREKDGELNIVISYSKNEYTIRIADNGIGREKAKDFSLESTGKGLSILGQILELYFNLMKIRITFTINDIIDNGVPAGTEVFISIPIVQS